MRYFCAPLTAVQVPGHQKIIEVGYGAIRKQAQDWIDEHRGNIMGDDVKRYLFYSSAVIACDACITYVRRTGDACLEKAEKEKDPKRKAELIKMGESLHWISTEPARNFFEAVEAALLYQFILLLDGCRAISMGRFDPPGFKLRCFFIALTFID